MAKPKVKEIKKVVYGNYRDGVDFEDYPNLSNEEWMGNKPLSLKDTLAKVFEINNDAINYEEEIRNAKDVDALADILYENDLVEVYNTYNDSWWGGTRQFMLLKNWDDKMDLDYETIAFISKHRGGDVRGNYEKYEAFELGDYGYESFPYYSDRLTYFIETDKGKITLDTEDNEGYYLMVVEDETGVVGEDETLSYEELGEKIDLGEKYKYDWGMGGVLLGSAIGGYIGYKIGRARKQKKGFGTEKKIAKKLKKGVKEQYKSYKKKKEKGGSISDYKVVDKFTTINKKEKTPSIRELFVGITKDGSLFHIDIGDRGADDFSISGSTDRRITESEAEEQTRDIMRDNFDEGLFNLDYIAYNDIDSWWFDEAQKESSESYAYDIQNEDDDEYRNRLVAEMVERGIVDEEKAKEEDFDEDDYTDEFVEQMANDYGDSREWFRDNFGEEEYKQVIVKNNLLDVDSIIDDEGWEENFDNSSLTDEVDVEGETWLFQAEGGGQNDSELDNLAVSFLPKEIINKIKSNWDKYHLSKLPKKEYFPEIEQDRDAILEYYVKWEEDYSKGGKVGLSNLMDYARKNGYEFSMRLANPNVSGLKYPTLTKRNKGAKPNHYVFDRDIVWTNNLIDEKIREDSEWRTNWYKDKGSLYAKGGEVEEEMQYGTWYVKIYEDENDEEIRNEEVARLIRDGYTSGFEPRWYLEITDIDGDIDYATEQHIAKLVEDGYSSGEVVMYKEDYAKGGKTQNEYKVEVLINEETEMGLNVFANSEDEAMDKADDLIREQNPTYEDDTIDIVNVVKINAKGGEVDKYIIARGEQYYYNEDKGKWEYFVKDATFYDDINKVNKVADISDGDVVNLSEGKYKYAKGGGVQKANLGALVMAKDIAPKSFDKADESLANRMEQKEKERIERGKWWRGEKKKGGSIKSGKYAQGGNLDWITG